MSNLSGWQIPEVYASVDRERAAVNTNVGICDSSPLGKVDVKGQDAFNFLQEAYEGIPDTIGLLGPASGGSGCEILCSRLAADHFSLITDPSDRRTALKDLNAKRKGRKGELYVIDMTSAYTSITLAGPRTMDLLSKLTTLDLATLSEWTCAQAGLAGVYARLTNIGKACHVFVPYEYGEYVWESMVEAGNEFDLTPFGLETWKTLDKKK